MKDTFSSHAWKGYGFDIKNDTIDVLVNLMDQYHPSHKAFEYKEISKSLNYMEYKQVYNYGKKLGLRLDKGVFNYGK